MFVLFKQNWDVNASPPVAVATADPLRAHPASGMAAGVRPHRGQLSLPGSRAALRGYFNWRPWDVIAQITSTLAEWEREKMNREQRLVNEQRVKCADYCSEGFDVEGASELYNHELRHCVKSGAAVSSASSGWRFFFKAEAKLFLFIECIFPHIRA